MKSVKGSGEIEYLMSNTWFVILVVISGFILWHLYVTSHSDSVNILEYGFTQINPVLETCKMENDVFGKGKNGFTCTFVNNAGSTAVISDLDVRINNKTCSTNQVTIDGSTTRFMRLCSNHRGNCPLTVCKDYVTGEVCPENSIEIKRNGVFRVTAYSDEVFHNSFKTEPCFIPNTILNNKVLVDIKYDLTIGGIRTSKRNTGIISLAN